MTEQQKFEAWAKSEHFDVRTNALGQYKDLDTFRTYEGWQARAAQDKSAELLEALERIVSFWDETVPADCVNSMHIQARAAISKARGTE